MMEHAHLGVCPWLFGKYRVSSRRYDPETHETNSWPWLSTHSDSLPRDNRTPWNLERCETVVGQLVRANNVDKYNRSSPKCFWLNAFGVSGWHIRDSPWLTLLDVEDRGAYYALEITNCAWLELFGVPSLVDHVRDGTLPNFDRRNLNGLSVCVSYARTYIANSEFVEYILLRRAHDNQEQKSGTRSADR
jgi:hypothetical protein